VTDLTQVKVPDIGDADGADIIEILVAVGDKVEKESPLIVLETDKATMEVPSSDAGVVKNILVNVGDQVSNGTVIIELEAAGGSNDVVADVEVAETVEEIVTDYLVTDEASTNSANSTDSSAK